MADPASDTGSLLLPAPRLRATKLSANYCGIGARLFSSYVQLGLINPVPLGGVASKRPRVLFDVRDLDDFIDAVKAAGSIDALLSQQNSSARMPADSHMEAAADADTE